MAFVVSVEQVTATFDTTAGATSQTVNLSKGQDETKCAAWYTCRATAAGSDIKANDFFACEMIDNGGTPAVRVHRHALAATTVSERVVEVFVVEFSAAVTVQQGSVSLTGTTVSDTISSITQTNAFAIFGQVNRSTSSGDDFDDAFIQCKFASDTSIQFDRRAGGTPDWDIYYYVIESNGTDFTTEYVEDSWTTNETGPTNLTISAVTLANSFVIPTYETSEGADDMLDGICNVALTGTTTLTWYRDSGTTPNATGTIGAWVVSSDSSGCEVQRFAIDRGSGTTDDTTITEVVEANSVIISSNYIGGGAWSIDNTTGGANFEDRVNTLTFTSSTNVRAQQQTTEASGGTGKMRFEVVEFITGISVSAVGDGSEPDTRTSVVVTGADFEASQGTGKVEIGSTAVYASATKVEVEVNTWSDTSINIDLHEITTTNPLLDDLSAGTVYCYVTNDSGDVSAGKAFTLKAPGATWAANLNTKGSVDVSSGNVTMRLRIQATVADADISGFVGRLYGSKNAGAYSQITASSSNVKIGTSSHFADLDDLTDNQLSAGTLVANNNAAVETVDGKFTCTDDFTTSTVLECEYALEFIAADLADADNYKFRLYHDTTAFDTYTVTADIDVVKGGADHDLLADDLESSSEVTSPAIGQEHAILADDTQSTSEVSSPAVGQEHALLADDTESASELSSPTLGEGHTLLANDVESASEVTSPAVGQEHALLADDAESASEVSAPAVGQEHSLAADDVDGASEVTAPAVGQEHALAANDVESASELSSPTLAEVAPGVDVLLANDVEGASEVTSPAVGQGHVLLADDAESASEVSAPSIGQVHDLAANDVESASQLSTPALSVVGGIDTHDGASQEDYERYRRRLRESQEEYEREREKLQERARQLRRDIEAAANPEVPQVEEESEPAKPIERVTIPQIDLNQFPALSPQMDELQAIIGRLAQMDVIWQQWQDDEDAMAALMLVA